MIKSQGVFPCELVIDIFNQLQARLPNSLEMSTYTEALKAGTKTYQDVQVEIAISDEYARF